MTRTTASLAFFLSTLLAGCAADQSGAVSPQADPGYTPTGSNIPRRTPPRAEQPARSGAAPAGSGALKP